MLAAAESLSATRSRQRPRPLSAQLRAETRVDHAAAEAGLEVASLRRAADLAGLLLGWRAVWSAVAGSASMPQAAATARAELLPLAWQAERWLQADLLALGHPPQSAGLEAPGGDAEPYRELDALLADAASAWGVAYVLRGSRLGGTVLAAQLGSMLGLRGLDGTAFLASSGTEPGREWVAFRHRMDDLHLTGDQRSDVVGAARWTFRWVGAVTAAHACHHPTLGEARAAGGQTPSAAAPSRRP